MKTLALIPGRSGSKSIPNKNIRPLAGQPLIAHTIGHALKAKSVERVVVSTDSEQYAEIARAHGAEVPFLRPAEFATDDATDLQVFTHALGWFQEKEDWLPDICVHLRPTFPSRDPEDIDRAVAFLQAHPEIDSVRSVVPAPETPYKMWVRDQDGMLSTAMQNGPPEAWNMPRQQLPPVFLQNASIDVVRSSVILEQHSMTGKRIYGLVMTEMFDIDHESQWQAAENHLLNQRRKWDRVSGSSRRVYCFDIDGVIASLTHGNDYALAKPLTEHIALVNQLYNCGHDVVLFTARGTKTGKDWGDVTKGQLRAWGVKHTHLQFGKPAADFYVDDRMITIQEVRQQLAETTEEEELER